MKLGQPGLQRESGQPRLYRKEKENYDDVCPVLSEATFGLWVLRMSAPWMTQPSHFRVVDVPSKSVLIIQELGVTGRHRH